MATYLALFAAILWVCWKLMHREGDDRYIGIGFAALVVAYAIHNSFIFDTSANYITFFSLAAFLAFLKDEPTELGKPRRATEPPPLTGMQLTALVIGLVVATVVLVRVNVRPSMANYATTRGIVAGWQGQFVQAMDKYDEAVAYETFGVYEYRQRMAQYLLEVAPQLNEYPEPFVDALLFAVSEVEKNTRLNEQDYLPLLYLARLHVILGARDSQSEYNDIALQYTQRALDISPTFVRTYYEVAQAYLNKGDIASAYEWFAKAQQLNPEVGITYWYMGITRFQLGDPEGALELVKLAVQNGYRLTQADTERLIGVYAQLGDLASIIGLLQRLVAENPENASYWSTLGTAYAQAGMVDEAVAAIRTAMDLDESIREEGEAVIERLLNPASVSSPTPAVPDAPEPDTDEGEPEA
jgi:tetratricopeptide (TPR) repeat protein